MPNYFNPENINDGSGIESTLQKNEAVWHKSCGNKFNNAELKQSQKRKSEEFGDIHAHIPIKRRRSSYSVKSVLQEVCFFCKKDEGKESLQAASTTKIDERVRECALELQDGKLLGKQSAGDMVALEAKYLIKCLASSYNCRRSCASSKLELKEDHLHGIVLAEIVFYIDEYFKTAAIKVPFLKLAVIAKMYKAKLEEFQVQDATVNSTRLKERIILAYLEISAYSQGRNVLLKLDSPSGMPKKMLVNKILLIQMVCILQRQQRLYAKKF